MKSKLILAFACSLALPTIFGCNDNPQTSELRKYAATDYLDGGLDEPTAQARPIFKKLLRKLMRLEPDDPIESKLPLLEECVLELNKIYSIETVERDIFMGAVEDIGVIVGLDQPSFDRLQELRDF